MFRFPFAALGVAAGAAAFVVSAVGTQSVAQHASRTPSTQHSVVTGATLPSVGQTWLADFGKNTPIGPFAARITFTSPTSATFVVTKGQFAGSTDTVDYTATRVRRGLFVVRWQEPGSGAYVTHVEDYRKHTVVSSVVTPDGHFIELDGKFVRVSSEQ